MHSSKYCCLHLWNLLREYKNALYCIFVSIYLVLICPCKCIVCCGRLLWFKALVGVNSGLLPDNSPKILKKAILKVTMKYQALFNAESFVTGLVFFWLVWYSRLQNKRRGTLINFWAFFSGSVLIKGGTFINFFIFYSFNIFFYWLCIKKSNQY